MDYSEEITEFIAARSASLLRYGYLLTGDHAKAEDLVQEALIRTCEHWGRLRDGSNPDAYVRRAMHNLNISVWRKITRRERTIDEVPLQFTLVSDGAEQRAEKSALMQAIEQLAPQQRTAVVLRYYEERTDAEIAQILECSEATVRSHLSRARTKLKAIMSGEQAPA